MYSPVICIGATLIDELFFCKEEAVAATSNPAFVKRAAGGVVCNIARHLGLLNIPVELISIVGNDTDGNWLRSEIEKCNVGTQHLIEVDTPTGKYVSILNKDGSLFAAACSDVSVEYLIPQTLKQYETFLSTASTIVSDTNLSVEAISWLSAFCKEKNIRLIIEPVSVIKAKKLAIADVSGIFMVTPNEDELPHLSSTGSLQTEVLLEDIINRGVGNVWLRKGCRGSSIYQKENAVDLSAANISVMDTTGAGDAALAGWIAADYLGLQALKCLQAGHALAFEVLQIKGAILENINQQKLFSSIQKYYPDVI